MDLVVPVNCLPNDKILDWSKLKALQTTKIKVLKMMTFVFDRVENTVTSIFSFSPQCFQRAFYPGSLKVGIVWYRVKQHFLGFQQGSQNLSSQLSYFLFLNQTIVMQGKTLEAHVNLDLSDKSPFTQISLHSNLPSLRFQYMPQVAC